MIKKITLFTLTFFCLGIQSLLAQCPNTFVTSFSPTSGPVNTTVTITGSGFQYGTGVSMVYFDGNEASYTIISDTQITAVVPEGATQGFVAVVGNGGCMAASTATFTPMESMCTAACEIYISELHDAQSNSPGAIEIYNPCPTTIVFGGQYTLERYGDINGSTPSYTLILPGSIGPNQTYLINSGPAPCGITPVAMMGAGINANDEFKLWKNGSMIDICRAPNNVGYTVIRNANATPAPSTTYNAADWNINLNESCSNLGMHTTTVTPPTAVVPTVINPDPVTICQYDYAVFSTGVSGSGWTYQWKTLNAAGQWVNVVNGGNFSGANTDTFVISNTPVSLNGTQYYCQITSTSCNLVTYAALLTVNAPQPPTVEVTQPNCNTPTGSILVTSPTTPAGITYSVNGTDYQTSPSFPNLPAGTYPVTVQDLAGCISAPVNVTLSAPILTPVFTVTQPTCTNPYGTIVITSPTGTGITYSINGTTYVPGTTFSPLAPGTYPVTAKSPEGCVSTIVNQVINPVPTPPAQPTATITQPGCGTNGQIVVTSPTGTGLQYSIDGTNYQSSATFNAVGAGTYQVTVKSGDCVSAPLSVTLTNGSVPSCIQNPDIANVTPASTDPYLSAKGSWFTSHGSPSPSPSSVWMFSYSGQTQGEGMYTCYNFEQGKTYKVCVNVDSDNLPGSLGYTNPDAQVYIEATNGTFTPRPAPAANQVIANWHMINADPQDFNYTFTASANFNKLWIFPYMQASASNANDQYMINVYSVKVEELPAATPAASLTGNTVTVTNTPPNGHWDWAPAGIATSQNAQNSVVTVSGNCSPVALVGTFVSNCQICSTYTVNVNLPAAPLEAPEVSISQPDCTSPEGIVEITSPLGTQYTYSADNGNTWQPEPIFDLAPGTYEILVQITAQGCESEATTVVINAPTGGPAAPTVTTVQPTCTTATGTITVTSPTGTGYMYSNDGGDTFQAGTTFTVTPGTYDIVVQDGGCTSAPTQVVINPAPTAPAVATTTLTQPDCDTATGTITITNPTGTGITYSIDNGDTWVTTTVFTVSPGTYTILTQNAAGCTSETGNIVINPAPAAPAVATTTVVQPDCDTATGTITVTNPTGTGFTYSINNGDTWVTTTLFTVDPGTYTIMVQNAAGCTSETGNIVINPAPAAPALATTTVVQPDCDTATGTITITAPVGTGYTYSIDNGDTWVTTTVFTVSPGTYTILTQNTAGCISQTNDIVINPQPAAPAVAGTTLVQSDCDTATGTITITAPVGTGITYSIDNGDTWVATTVFTVDPGTYTIMVQNANGCTSETGNLVINPQPATPAIATTTVTQPDCDTATGSITITAPVGPTITYSADGGTTWQASPVFTLSPGTYTIITQNAAGCTSETGNITINPQPASPAVAGTTLVQPDCDTATGTITITAPVGTGITYSIDNGNTWVSTTVFTVGPGTYTILTQNANGCTSQTGNLVINPQPATPAAPTVTATQPGCTTQGTITITAPLGAGYTYSTNGINYVAATTFTLAPGTYQVTAKNAAGCISPATTQVINAAPPVPATPSVTVTHPTCTVNTGTITITAPTGPGITYSIDGTTYVATATFTLAPGTYPVTVKNASGCVSPINTQTINPVPQLPATPALTVTQPGCGQTLGSIVVTSPTGTGMQYSKDGGTTWQNSPTFGNLPPAIYTIVVKNASGCLSAPVQQTINPAPTVPAAPVLAVTQPDCNTATGTITVTAPPAGATYSINNGPFGTVTSFSTLPQGTYTITVKNADGCTAWAQQSINAAPPQPPVPTVSLIQPDCDTATGRITVTSPLGGGHTYSLDGVLFQASPTFPVVNPGTYTLTVKNNTGCTSILANIVINTPPAPAPSPGVITGPGTVCIDGTLQLANVVTGGTWASTNTNVATVDATGLVTPVNPGTVTITYTVGTICTDFAERVITIVPLPQPHPADIYYLCVDNETGEISPVTIYTGLTQTDNTFAWTKDGDPLPFTTTSIVVNEPGEYEVTVTNTASGCSNTATTTVGTSSLAVAYAEVGEDFHANQMITVHVTGGTGDYEYSLDGGPYQDENYFTGIISGEYTITVRDKHGCGIIGIEVFALNYPHYFTPNDDGNQDYWNITGLSSQYNARIFVFDRYGKLITFIRPSGSRGWDGTLNGHRLPATDYWFTVEYRSSNGEDKEYKAHFSLIR